MHELRRALGVGERALVAVPGENSAGEVEDLLGAAGLQIISNARRRSLRFLATASSRRNSPESREYALIPISRAFDWWGENESIASLPRR